MRQVVVTGGGTGIGFAIATRMREAGEHVVITGRRKDVLENAAGRIEADPVVCDATDPAAIEAATELGPRGITANVVAPRLILDTEFFRDRLTEERQESLVGATLTGRAGRPHDVAGTVDFLTSDDAAHITGQVIHVNGGAYLGP